MTAEWWHVLQVGEVRYWKAQLTILMLRATFIFVFNNCYPNKKYQSVYIFWYLLLLQQLSVICLAFNPLGPHDT